MSITYIIVSVAIVVAFTLTYFLLAKKAKKKSILPINFNVAILPDNIIDKKGEVTLVAVVEWFKNLPLDKNKHAPFIATNQELWQTVTPATFVEVGKQVLFLGVLNENNREIEFFSVMIGDSFSIDLKSTIGNNEIIMLS